MGLNGDRSNYNKAISIDFPDRFSTTTHSFTLGHRVDILTQFWAHDCLISTLDLSTLAAGWWNPSGWLTRVSAKVIKCQENWYPAVCRSLNRVKAKPARQTQWFLVDVPLSFQPHEQSFFEDGVGVFLKTGLTFAHVFFATCKGDNQVKFRELILPWLQTSC